MGLGKFYGFQHPSGLNNLEKKCSLRQEKVKRELITFPMRLFNK